MKYVLVFVCLLSAADLARSQEIEKIERVTPRTWYLGMNLNPADGHVMDFTTGWADNVFIGTYQDALKKDYLNREVWGLQVKYIAIVRHQAGVVDAVKVFRFRGGARSLLSRFQDMNPGRQVAITLLFVFSNDQFYNPFNHCKVVKRVFILASKVII